MYDDETERLADDWRASARQQFEGHRRRLKELRRCVEDSKEIFPPGAFDRETGAPVDLASACRACCELLDEEFFREAAERLDAVLGWLDGSEQPPLASVDRTAGS